MPASRSSREAAGRALAALMELAARLRAPDGCPWDRKQTTASAAPYLLEESCEAVEALEAGDSDAARGELGDVLFQVVFQAQLFAETGGFNLAQVIEEVRAKMVRRHPHVFGQDQASDPGQVKELWGRIKQAERGDQRRGLLEGVPLGLPSLARAQRLGQRAGRVGFDWRDAAEVEDKIDEETEELAAAESDERAAEELGDVLFVWAQWARHRGLNAEQALRSANRRFERRVAVMEGLAAGRGQDLAELDPEALESLWEEAKILLAEGPATAETEPS